ncbi:aerobic respiration control sensor protein arcB [Dendryphion nanum]|uniref:histidine kinase n=1 Tax=Dendryphion nanum TaxID=256645 RepID=A0A9P9DJQ9_9PLEO|nr:aerobic respiration control sensor protein arcB [Dendryphion nanum]
MSGRSPGPHDSDATARTDDTKDSLANAAFNELDALSLKEIWDQDSRPTFVLDLDPDFVEPHGGKDAIRPIFFNVALHDRLLDRITGLEFDDSEEAGPPDSAATYDQFRAWATGFSRLNDSREVFPLTILYQNLLWTGSTIRRRWRIISGNHCYQASHLPRGDLSASPGKPSSTKERIKRTVPKVEAPLANSTHMNVNVPLTPQPSDVAPTEQSKNTSNDTSGSSSSIPLTTPPENSVPDWTVKKYRGVLPDHVIFARNVDWASTPLGPMENWTIEFREVVNLLMRNPHPAALFWGEELTMVYNEAYKIEVAGNKHPDLMGTGFSGPFSELWDGVGPIFRECARTGKSVRKENDPLPIHRYGYLEETFFSWSFTPVYGGTDHILGFYNAPFETTYQTISSRRMHTLRYLGECLFLAKSVKNFWKKVLEGLEHNHYDVPFALLYSIVDTDDADTASHSSDSTLSLKSCMLEGAIGIPNGHPASPSKLDLKRSHEGFIPAFREAMRTREPTTLHTRDGSLPEELLDGIAWRGSGDPCRDAIIFPVRPTNGDTIFAFLLIGINPRRAYDDDYKDFAAMLNRQLATSLASVLLFEDEIRRSRNAAEVAALQREQLSRELELQTSRMKRMTELSTMGMYLFSPGGVLLEANDRYYEMTGHPRDNTEEFAFLNTVADSSRQDCQDMWKALILEARPHTAELQLKTPMVISTDLTGEPIDYWVLASSQPEIGIDGKIISILGSITDISHMKWAQGLQDRRLREAEETKRQQNEFIDITSHEMRNPLSAILICADDIRDSLSHHRFADADAAVISECIEAANNIALCVQHQKSIVDDILTVSKLDSNLLLITPVPSQVVAVVQRSMSMFRPEVQAKDIQFDFVPHLSLQDFGIDWMMLDPSRLLQIIVNLITNAIKFTAASPKRMISVHVGVSKYVPENPDFEYVPTRGSPVVVPAGEDWGHGDLLYLHFEVADTGCGLTAEEKALLFERFSQASPRTHAHYGGSGLGLFISRQLAELHGGQIGVSSEAGVGSTFGFFIQARKVADSNRPPITRQSSSQSDKPDRAETSRALAVAMSGLALNAPDGPEPEDSNPLEFKQLHVLIVEDNLVNQKVLFKQLQKAGCIVHTADNGVFALAHLETTEFYKGGKIPLSVILMDLEMPEMDGLTCVGLIRKMEAEGVIRRHVPVIAVTANVRGEQIATARESGMDDVVSKPFRVPELLAKVHVLLNRLALAEKARF